MTSPRPWVAHYDPGVPHTLEPYPQRTLLDLFADGLRERPDAPVVLFKGAALSHRTLDEQANAFAAALIALGVKPGDRVALLLPNCPQFLVAEFGVWRAGAVVVPLNPIYSAEEMHGPLVLSGAETVVTLTPFYARVREAMAGTAVKRVIATNIKEYLPPLLRLAFTLLKERKEGHRITLASGDLSFPALLAQHAGAPAPAHSIALDDVATLLLTGGTTGEPKCAETTFREYTCAALQLRAWLGHSLTEWTAPVMLPLPLFHVYGNVGVQSLATATHNPVVLVPNPRDLTDVLKTIRATRPAFFCGVPTLYNAIINHPLTQAGKIDFHSMKACVSGASPLMQETKLRFEQLTGGRIIEGYALTESGMAAVLNPIAGPNKPGSVGMPTPDVEVRIVDGDTGDRIMPTGEVGEIIIRAPNLMKGYFRNPAETAAMLRNFGPGGKWLYTGDLGFLDADGYLFIVDRKKDLIKASGFQVWPREVEEVVAKHPAVQDVGVVGAPDAGKGEIVVAHVVLRPGMSANEEEIRAFARQHLAPYKAPSRVEFHAELPKTMVGKVLRRKLREPAGAAH
ncbi:MAG TPA: AMP-binding protein [Gemmatimonadaceae bacterium]|nr:AMP-binding protein [Gemmatimonadaceae bacterium]